MVRDFTTRKRIPRSRLLAGITLGMCLLAVSLPCLALAQSVLGLSKGQRVRIMMPAVAGQRERYITGNLIRLERDTVVVVTDSREVPETLSIAIGEGRGRRLEVGGVRRAHGGKGAALGAVLGILAGGMVGAAIEEGSLYGGSSTQQAAAGMVVGEWEVPWWGS